jgi:glutamate synthase domain-containing protein 3
LIEEHQRRTGSQRAFELLEDWENTVGRMVKVVPVEYRRVLSELAAAKEKSSTGAALPVIQAAK